MSIVARIVPLRFLMAFGSAALLLALLPVLPDYPGLRPMLILFAAALLVQGLNLKWFFMGQERLGAVAAGLLIAVMNFTTSTRIHLIPMIWSVPEKGIRLSIESGQF